MSAEQAHPAGWTTTQLGTLAEYINGAAFRPVDWQNDGIPIIRIQNLTDPSKPLNRTSRRVNPRLLIRLGDLLFSWSATLDAFVWAGEDAWLNQHIFKVLPCPEVVNARFLYYLLKAVARELIESEHAHGSTMQHVNRGPFLLHSVALPPLEEQSRIADALDELFSDLDAGVAALERARAKLALYRASVLKAAVEGPLTAEWRAEYPDAEPASRLLERILAERRRRWEEAQLVRFKEKGKTPPKGWRSKYREPVAPDVASLPTLPDGWCWATLDQCAELIQYGSSTKSSSSADGVPVIRMGNLTSDGRLVLDDLKTLPAENDEFPALLLSVGDLLFNRTNSAELVGKTAVYEGTPAPCSFVSYLIRVRLLAGVAPRFLMHVLNSTFGREWIKTVANQTVGQANVNGSKLAAFTFPLPPVAEQELMLETLDEQLSIVGHQESDLESKARSVQSLRQSILRHAFSGKLVPQDSDDEPASELLKRIAAERNRNAAQASEARRPAKKRARIRS